MCPGPGVAQLRRLPRRPDLSPECEVLPTTVFGRYRLVKATDATLDDLYRDGLSIAEIADRTGIAPSTTRRRLIAAGVELRQPGPPRIRPSLDTLKHLRDYLTLRPSEIARHYQVSPSTVTAWLDYYQLPHPPHGQPPTLSVLRSEFTDAGMTLAEIGDNHGVTRQTVARWS